MFGEDAVIASGCRCRLLLVRRAVCHDVGQRDLGELLACVGIIAVRIRLVRLSATLNRVHEALGQVRRGRIGCHRTVWFIDYRF